MLSHLLGRRSKRGTGPPPLPEVPVEIVGDIHGRMDLLRGLPPSQNGAVRVYVGDYVDRGPDSAAVLKHIYAESLRDGRVCLMGNHEAMLLRFLEAPSETRSWLRYGGLPTLASFGIDGVAETSSEDVLQEAAHALEAGVSFDLVDWLRSLPYVWSSGNLAVAHAGLDPMLPFEAQSRDYAIWGHPEFAGTPRRDGGWVAHGHAIVSRPTATGGVILVDTGAYASGRLTMARVSCDGDITFETSAG